MVVVVHVVVVVVVHVVVVVLVVRLWLLWSSGCGCCRGRAVVVVVVERVVVPVPRVVVDFVVEPLGAMVVAVEGPVDVGVVESDAGEVLVVEFDVAVVCVVAVVVLL